MWGSCLAATVLRALWTDLHLLDDRRRQGPAHATVGAQGRRRAGEGVERIHPPRHPRKDDVAGRQRIVVVEDEELAAVGVRSGVGHRDQAALVAVAIERRSRVDL